VHDASRPVWYRFESGVWTDAGRPSPRQRPRGEVLAAKTCVEPVALTHSHPTSSHATNQPYSSGAMYGRRRHHSWGPTLQSHGADLGHQRAARRPTDSKWRGWGGGGARRYHTSFERFRERHLDRWVSAVRWATVWVVHSVMSTLAALLKASTFNTIQQPFNTHSTPIQHSFNIHANPCFASQSVLGSRMASFLKQRN
jgi:hypothetical protein